MIKNSNQTITLRAVDYARSIPAGFLTATKWLFFALWLISGILLLVYGWMPANWLARTIFLALPTQINTGLWQGVFLAAVSIWALCVLIIAFARQKLTRMGKNFNKKGGALGNILEYFDFEAARIYKKTLAYPHLPFEKLLFYYILLLGDLSFSLDRLGVQKADLKKKLLAAMKERSKSFAREDKGHIQKINEESRQAVFESARQMALKIGSQKITIYALFLALAQIDREFQKTLDALELPQEDVVDVVLWQARRAEYQSFRQKFWERENLRLGLGASPALMAAGGYTPFLDAYARDLSLCNPLRPGGVVLHLAEIEQMEAILAKKRESGVLLVGEPGSGRKSAIYNFVNRIMAESGSRALKMTRVLEIDIPKMAGDFAGGANLAAAIENAFSEAAAAKNVVLVIPEIDSYLGSHFDSDKLVKMDIGNILGKYLDVNGFRVIGITDYQGSRRCAELAAGIAGKLAKIEIPAASFDDALRVIKEESLRRETQTGLCFRFAALKEIARLCDYFADEGAFPKKAVVFLDNFVADRLEKSGRGLKIIAAADIGAFFSRKYGIPAGITAAQEKDVLLNLEERIHEKLINQKEAVSEIANALRRARAEIKKRKRTIGNFLFLGPTGVGKTETAKQLARVYFGSEKNMIVFNMAEYQTAESLEKLIGNARTPGRLAAAVRENPFSLLLLDEIEKADARVLDVFLSVFDEGSLIDGLGRTIDFRHVVIIATSNAGADRIKAAIDGGGFCQNFKESLINDLIQSGIFKPEFLNRFDAITLYRSLNIEEIRQVATLALREIARGLAQKRIKFQITEELIGAMAEIGFDPAFGGRALRRAVQNNVENSIARALLSQSIKAGDVIAINPKNWEIIINEDPKQQ